VLADGTYATESVYSQVSPTYAAKDKSKPNLRTLILGGDYFIATVLATTLTKMILRIEEMPEGQGEVLNSNRVLAMLIMTSIIRVGVSSSSGSQTIDEDSHERVLSCLKLLSLVGKGGPVFKKLKTVFLKDCHKVYQKIVEAHEKELKNAKMNEKNKQATEVDALLQCRLLTSKASKSAAAAEKSDAYVQDILKATGANEIKPAFTNKLNRIVQLTGFSDSVYAEAYVDVHQFDILLGTAAFVF
jgi:coatomer subunit beta